VTVSSRRVLQMRLVVEADDYEDAVRFYRDVARGPRRASSGYTACCCTGLPDATMHVDEQLAERDLVATRNTFRGTRTVRVQMRPHA
jgi:hypothetical protein